MIACAPLFVGTSALCDQLPPSGAQGSGTATRANARVALPEMPYGDMTFAPIADLSQKANKVKLQLREAVVADPRDWPASFMATFPTSRGEASCTAVLIGPQVMLTAAHCIPPSKQISYGRKGVTPKTATCARDEQWESGEDSSADFALCRLDTPFVEPPNFQYETVSLTQLTPTHGASEAVVLSGFGCTDNTTVQQKLDDNYRVGLTALIDSSLSPDAARGPNYYAATGGEKNNLMTDDDGPNLCPGDSGGPAFQPSSTFSKSQVDKRSVIGVNSRVFYKDDDGTLYGASLISALGAGRFETWARRWLGALPACGLQGAIPKCRD